MAKGSKSKRKEKSGRKRDEAGGASGEGCGPAGRKRRGKEKRGRYKGDVKFTSFREQLSRKGFRLQICAADGNCFFRAVGQQIEIDYETLRVDTCDYIAANAEIFRPFVEDEDETFEEYVKTMRDDGEWAGQPEMMAVSWGQGVSIWVHQAHPEPTYLIDAGNPNAKVIHVSYHEGIHFNAVYPNAEAGEAVAKILAAGPAEVEGKTDAQHANTPTNDERLVMTSTGCSDLAAVRRVVERAAGDPARAIEIIIAEEATAAAAEDIASADADAAAIGSTGLEEALMAVALEESVADVSGDSSVPIAPDSVDGADGKEAKASATAVDQDSAKPKSRSKPPSKRDKKKDKKMRRLLDRQAIAKAEASGPPPPDRPPHRTSDDRAVPPDWDEGGSVIRM